MNHDEIRDDLVSPLRGLPIYGMAFPPLTRWATLCRPCRDGFWNATGCLATPLLVRFWNPVRRLGTPLVKLQKISKLAEKL